MWKGSMDNLNASLVASREQSLSKEDMVECTGGFDKNATLDQADEKNKSLDEQGLTFFQYIAGILCQKTIGGKLMYTPITLYKIFPSIY